MTRDPDGASLAWAILNGANRTFLVPAVLAQVLQSGPDAIKLFGALKTYTYGAAPMPTPLLRAAMEAWPQTEFMQVYGLTEVGGVITHLLPEAHLDTEHPERLLSAGTVLPEAECRVVDVATGEDVARRRAGRAVVPHPAADEGLPRQAGGDRQGDHRRRLVPHRRHRPDRRGRLRLRRGPAQGHDHLGRREHLLPRGRARPRRAPGGRGVRGDRRTGRAVGRGGQGGRGTEAGHRRPPRRRSSPSPGSGWPTSSAPGWSTSCRRCRATRPARSSRRTCGRRTGRVTTAPSSEGAPAHADRPAEASVRRTGRSVPVGPAATCGRARAG